MAVKAVVIAEDEVGEVVTFDTEAELKAFRDGVGVGSDAYGAGSCEVFTLDDLDDADYLSDRVKAEARKALMS